VADGDLAELALDRERLDVVVGVVSRRRVAGVTDGVVSVSKRMSSKSPVSNSLWNAAGSVA
jgi:hypothetical protein